MKKFKIIMCALRVVVIILFLAGLVCKAFKIEVYIQNLQTIRIIYFFIIIVGVLFLVEIILRAREAEIAKLGEENNDQSLESADSSREENNDQSLESTDSSREENNDQSLESTDSSRQEKE